MWSVSISNIFVEVSLVVTYYHGEISYPESHAAIIRLLFRFNLKIGYFKSWSLSLVIFLQVLMI